MLRLDADDPVAAWQERMKAIVASADRLTERRFDAIHLKGPGTDLTIGLLPSSTWLGANFTTVDGLVHHPNLPSEEVFTTPDPERVDGHVSSTMPLELYGSHMDGIRARVRGRESRQGRRGRRRGRAPGNDREGRGSVAPRRARARRQGGPHRPAPHGLLRHAHRRERRQPPRARQRLHLPGRGRGRPRAGERELRPRRLHGRLQRDGRRRDHARRRARPRVARRFLAALGRPTFSRRLRAPRGHECSTEERDAARASTRALARRRHSPRRQHDRTPDWRSEAAHRHPRRRPQPRGEPRAHRAADGDLAETAPPSRKRSRLVLQALAGAPHAPSPPEGEGPDPGGGVLCRDGLRDEPRRRAPTRRSSAVSPPSSGNDREAYDPGRDDVRDVLTGELSGLADRDRVQPLADLVRRRRRGRRAAAARPALSRPKTRSNSGVVR